MKKLLLSLTVVSALFFTSCEDDTSDVVLNITNNTTNNNDNGGGNGGGQTETTINIGGVQTADLTLDGPANNVIYVLTEGLVMEEGTTLTITAGTRIESNAGTEGYIAIKQGATIDAQGTQCNPIVMTSSASNPSAGNWGGVVILGKAPINAGDTATSEVGGFTYGGTDAADNSGIIKYVRLEYTGAAINTESEFNGFSMYAVGNGTVVENIESFEGADDGIEFFGGTVNVDNLVVVNAQDDSVDWTEGWVGTVNNVYVKMNAEGDHAIEADGNEDDNTAQPYSSPTFNNATFIGAATGQEAFRIRRGTQVNMNNVWVENFAEGFDIDNALTAEHIANDLSNINNITFLNVDNYLITSDDTATATVDNFFSGIGNGTITDVANWANCWSTVGGATTGRVIELSGTYNSDYTLNPANTYKLSGSMIMEAGTTLTIPAGVEVKCAPSGTQVNVAIKQGAKIMAEGSESDPIVFTSNASSPAPGDWGGIVILGNATINAGDNATSEILGLSYGGSNDADNSGVIKNVRLEYTGAAINTESEYNGFSFYAVGSGTTVENIESYKGADDGVEFFGGTVSATNVALIQNEDDSLDWTEGWRGTLTNVYIVQNANGDHAIEADGNEDDNTATPLSSPTINNLTAIGGDGTQEAFRIRRGTQVNMTNVYVKDYAEGFDVDNAATADHIVNNLSNIVNVTFDNVTLNLKTDDNTVAVTEDNFFSGIGNGTMLDTSAWGAWFLNE